MSPTITLKPVGTGVPQIYFSANIEIFMLNNDNQNSSNSNPITDVILPNAILSNGIVIDTQATSDCQATDKGKKFNNYCRII